MLPYLGIEHGFYLFPVFINMRLFITDFSGYNRFFNGLYLNRLISYSVHTSYLKVKKLLYYIFSNNVNI